VCATSPTAGAGVSGPLSAWVGGYEHRNALKLALVLMLFTGALAVPMALFDNFWYFAINLWFYLFFGGILVPLLTGVFLANVEVEYRTKASSMANIFYEAFGFAPAPYVWGAIQTATGGKKSRWGLISTLCFSVLAVLFLAIAVLHQRCSEEERQNQKKIDRE